METQKLDRILKMVEGSESLKKQYKENPDETIRVLTLWLDTEEKGAEIDPHFSRKQALEFDLQRLDHDLKVLRERGNLEEALLVEREIEIKKQRLPLIGREAENQEEVLRLGVLEEKLAEDKATFNARKAVSHRVPRLVPRIIPNKRPVQGNK